MITKAVIPAAGFGTRMLPAAKAVPKELLPVLDRPTIQYVVEEAAAAGATDVLLVTARDIVTRLPDADEARIRLELSGNICRCTGYVGIVNAIQAVLKARA